MLSNNQLLDGTLELPREEDERLTVIFCQWFQNKYGQPFRCFIDWQWNEYVTFLNGQIIHYMR